MSSRHHARQTQSEQEEGTGFWNRGRGYATTTRNPSSRQADDLAGTGYGIDNRQPKSPGKETMIVTGVKIRKSETRTEGSHRYGSAIVKPRTRGGERQEPKMATTRGQASRITL